MSYSGEADEMLYTQHDKEERRRKLLAKGWNADIAEACEADGCIEGHITCTHDQGCCASPGCPGWECPRCLGTGVQP